MYLWWWVCSAGALCSAAVWIVGGVRIEAIIFGTGKLAGAIREGLWLMRNGCAVIISHG